MAGRERQILFDRTFICIYTHLYFLPSLRKKQQHKTCRTLSFQAKFLISFGRRRHCHQLKNKRLEETGRLRIILSSKMYYNAMVCRMNISVRERYIL